MIPIFRIRNKTPLFILLFQLFGTLYGALQNQYKLLVLLQLLCLLLLVVYVSKDKGFNRIEINITPLIYKYFLFICLITIVRGVFIPLKGWNILTYILHETMMYMFIIPVVLLFPISFSTLKSIYNISILSLIIGYFYIIFFSGDLFFNVEEILLSMKQTGFEFGPSQRSQYPIQFLIPSLVFLPIINSKTLKILIWIYAILSVLAVLLWGRRTSLFMIILLLIPFIINYINRYKKMIIISLCIIGIYIVPKIDVERTFEDNFHVMYNRYDDDTRSGTEKDFYNDFNMTDWLFGRGLSGTYKSPDVAAEDTFNRPLIETGYLHIVLKGGLVLLVPYIIILIYSSYCGIFKSRSLFLKYAGYYILSHLILLYPWGHTGLNLESYILWLFISLVMSRKFRGLNDNQFKKILIS